MSPIDDELRAALHRRADTLAPAPDPLGGIESRARGMKRRRLAASVAGTAMVVAAIAVAVPVALSNNSANRPDPFASGSPSSTPSAPDYALDPAKPWPFRGDASLLGSGTLDTMQREWQVKHPGSTITALFAQTYEPSQQVEVLFVGRGDGADRLGLMRTGEPGPVLMWEDAIAQLHPVSLAIALPGDEVGRLLVVASPSAGAIEYAPDGTTFARMAPLAPGVATGPREGSADARYRVLDGQGNEIDSAGAPDTETSPSAPPSNVLDWPTRGAGESDLLPKAKAAVAPTLQATADQVQLKVLFAGDTDSGVTYLMGQAWKRGSTTAYSFAYAEGGTNGPSTYVGPATKADTKVLAFVFDSLPGTVGELLVVVPIPTTGQVSYDRDATGGFTPVTGQDYLDGVVLIDRTAGETDDRLEVLNGNGDLDNPNYRGPVLPLLCGYTECG